MSVHNALQAQGTNGDREVFKIAGDEDAKRANTYDTDNPRLAGDVLATPGKVARVETERTVLEAATADTDGVHTLGSKLGVGRLTAELELSLLAVVRALGTRVRTLVPGGAGDTCTSCT